MRPWLDSNESALALFETSLIMPEFYIPPRFVVLYEFLSGRDTGFTDLSDASLSSDLAKCFYERCLYRLSLGETEGAWQDVWVVYRILELHRPGTGLSLIENSQIRYYANKLAESVLLNANWSEEKIRRAAQEIADSQHLLTDADAQQILQGERLRVLASLQNNWGRLPSSLPIPLPDSVLPTGYAMVTVNRYFDEQSGKKYRKQSDYIDSIKDINNTESRGLIKFYCWYGWRNYWGFVMGANETHWGRIADQIDCQTIESELTVLVFALELYRKEHENRYPATLETLCNGYIEKVPVDPFSNVGKSVIYKVDDDCTGYLIYSVGVNRTDNGGQDDDIWRKR